MKNEGNKPLMNIGKLPQEKSGYSQMFQQQDSLEVRVKEFDIKKEKNPQQLLDIEFLIKIRDKLSYHLRSLEIMKDYKNSLEVSQDVQQAYLETIQLSFQNLIENGNLQMIEDVQKISKELTNNQETANDASSDKKQAKQIKKELLKNSNSQFQRQFQQGYDQQVANQIQNLILLCDESKKETEQFLKQNGSQNLSINIDDSLTLVKENSDSSRQTSQKSQKVLLQNFNKSGNNTPSERSNSDQVSQLSFPFSPTSQTDGAIQNQFSQLFEGIKGSMQNFKVDFKQSAEMAQTLNNIKSHLNENNQLLSNTLESALHRANSQTSRVVQKSEATKIDSDIFSNNLKHKTQQRVSSMMKPILKEHKDALMEVYGQNIDVVIKLVQSNRKSILGQRHLSLQPDNDGFDPYKDILLRQQNHDIQDIHTSQSARLRENESLLTVKYNGTQHINNNQVDLEAVRLSEIETKQKLSFDSLLEEEGKINNVQEYMKQGQQNQGTYHQRKDTDISKQSRLTPNFPDSCTGSMFDNIIP
eukprot:403370531